MTEEAKKGEAAPAAADGNKVDPAEVSASSKGWKPKDQWEGNPEEWKDAKTFIKDGELFDKIDQLKKENYQTKRTLNALKGHYDKVRETEFNHALTTLKAMKKQALDEGDTDKVVQVDDQILDTRARMQAEQQASAAQAAQQQPGQLHPEFTSWVEKNAWYAQDKELRAVADGIGISYAANNPQLTPKEVLKFVEKQIRNNNPDKFSNSNRDKPTAVEGGSGRPAPKSRDSVDLSDVERKIMNDLVSQGVLTREKYMADLKAIKERK